MTDLNNASPFLDAEEAAARIKLKRGTLKRLRTFGGGPPFIRVSARKIIYDAEKLDAWARAREFASTSGYDAAAA